MRTRRIVVISIATLGLAGLTACGNSSSDSGTSPAAPVTAAQGAGSTADVAFAQSMIPHHRQAVEMADLALADQSGASDPVKQLAQQIKDAQDPEIGQMTMWLQQWGAPTAMPGATSADQMSGIDHGGHDMGGMTVSGMMTDKQMADLTRARGRQFDDMWLTMMLEHHQGAIAMARQARSSSDNPDVTALADRIISAQQSEIATMQNILAGAGR